MPYRKRVIEELERVVNAIVDGYIHEPDRAANAITNAIDMLKEQEAVEPILKREAQNKNYNDYVCPRCYSEVVYEQNFCSECGVPFIWEGR